MGRRIAGSILALAVAGCGGGDDGPRTCSVGYTLSGTAPFSVTYAAPGGSTQQERVTNAAFFAKAFTFQEGDFLYLSAQTESSNVTASVTVRISKDGDTGFRSANSFGPFTIATASGSC